MQTESSKRLLSILLALLLTLGMVSGTMLTARATAAEEAVLGQSRAAALTNGGGAIEMYNPVVHINSYFPTQPTPDSGTSSHYPGVTKVGDNEYVVDTSDFYDNDDKWETVLKKAGNTCTYTFDSNHKILTHGYFTSTGTDNGNGTWRHTMRSIDLTGSTLDQTSDPDYRLFRFVLFDENNSGDSAQAFVFKYAKWGPPRDTESGGFNNAVYMGSRTSAAYDDIRQYFVSVGNYLYEYQVSSTSTYIHYVIRAAGGTLTIRGQDGSVLTGEASGVANGYQMVQLNFSSANTYYDFIFDQTAQSNDQWNYQETTYRIRYDDGSGTTDPDMTVSSAGVRSGYILNEYGMHGTQFETVNGVQVPTRSLPVAVKDAPSDTKSYAILMEDLSVDWVHWMAVEIGTGDIPANASKSGAIGMVQGTNDFGSVGYGGPTPPDGDHRYAVTVYALNTDTLGLSEGFSQREFQIALSGHILSTATLTATYRHEKADDPNPEETTYTLTLQAGSGGTITQGAGGDYQAGTVIRISASPSTGYRFSSWSASPSIAFDNAASASTSFVMPAFPVTVTANFTRTSTGGSGGGSSSGGGGGSGGSNTSDQQRSSSGTGSGLSGSRSGNVNADGTVNAAVLQSEVAAAVRAASGSTVTVTLRNAASISATALKNAAAAASGKTLVLTADTLSTDGKSVQGRLYVEPAKLTARTTDLKLGVYTEEAQVSKVQAFFQKWFSNRVAVVKLEERGALGARLQVAAKVDLTGLNTGNLVLYSFDLDANTYTRLADPGYTVDANGYLHFYTSQGGYIIISNGPLTAK